MGAFGYYPTLSWNMLQTRSVPLMNYFLSKNILQACAFVTTVIPFLLSRGRILQYCNEYRKDQDTNLFLHLDFWSLLTKDNLKLVVVLKFYYA